MLHSTGAPAGDYRHRDRGTDRTQQSQVESGFGAVGVHRVEQDLPHTEVGATGRPLHGVHTGATTTAVSGDLPTRRCRG
ncbi:Uncharacterised protein [Mycobacterium tuberculosis]|uniref:Uncharacterized protein n=1 Tax=Mycobacterium tuberculosis TaxID=1773 RepID=A0A0U0RM40_MYCTX|nr:Uncharacterised protein [Mycobacterium tuberculosis]